MQAVMKRLCKPTTCTTGLAGGAVSGSAATPLGVALLPHHQPTGLPHGARQNSHHAYRRNHGTVTR